MKDIAIFKMKQSNVMFEELKDLNCVLQFVRSGRVAITTSCFERVSEYLDMREEQYRLQKKEDNHE